ncbi:D-hexose-6-phosphate mutarotase [Pasteurella skyensis]|uniref:Putative glucose-6-phosphate 1-epimerase n=1 Tax=Phocoenobacter skyensis TaxID=97481 RepID=A0AAJ6NCK0_9PAST|nr:D-hexose-6-phosphate mutarotase [Pasteurella skyensis]MDP8170157.1 D-hexose-6-phosphate mutarotase [Pasteurella skyensis]MDP8174339.1 D-hexose-6-phosphate mutarotase [Pasteurella skyensis]
MLNGKLHFIKQITPELSLQQCNEIPIIVLKHKVGKALISLQGAHLLSWQPLNADNDIFWLSEIESFKLGSAIRGGVPICYPWFGGKHTPSHGYARISLWQLSDYKISDKKISLEFSLFSDNEIIEAKMVMHFTEQCQLDFIHYGQETAQVALHSYFNIGDINSVSVTGLPTTCFNSLTQQQEEVASPRQVSENIDCIYEITAPVVNTITDPVYQRRIDIHHIQANNIVFWNPWHKATNGMTSLGYQKMLCIETAQINKPLSQGEKVSVVIGIKNLSDDKFCKF